MAYAGLETLFQNMGPTYAASIAGEREGTAQFADQLSALQTQEAVKKARQEYSQNEIMNPLKIEQQTLENAGRGYTNRKEAVEAETKERTKESGITKTLSANEQAIISDKLKNMDTYSQILGAWTPTLESIPAAGRHAQLLQMVRSQGIDVQDPKLAPILQQLSKVPGEKLPQALDAIRQKMISQSSVYRQAMDVALEHSKSAANVAGIHAKSAKDVAEINATSREKVSASRSKATDIISSVQAGKMTAEKAAVAFDTMAAIETDPAQKQLYTQQAQRFEQLAMQLRNAGAGGKPDISQMGVPTIPVSPALGNKPKAGTAENPIKLD